MKRRTRVAERAVPRDSSLSVVELNSPAVEVNVQRWSEESKHVLTTLSGKN